MIAALIELAAQRGYQAVSVAQLSSHAGVSSATFYEQFQDKEDCLLAAYREVAAGVFARMSRARGQPGWAGATRAALDELVASLQADPDGARVLYIEAMAGGSRLREELTQVLAGFEGRAERLLDQPPEGTTTLDIPAKAAVGAVRSVISRHLRSHSEDRLHLLSGDLLTWMAGYEVPGGRERWSVGPRALLARAPDDTASWAPAPTPEPARLPRGRHGLPPAAVARSQRTRIINAIAQVTMAKGYAATTVADIVASAGVAKEAFYQHFNDKQHAFLEAQQHPTQHILDTCTAAYFSAAQWPERVWRGLGTLLVLIAENPAISHMRLVECYAVGADAARRAEEITRSFTFFLEEGYGYRPQAAQLPRLCSQAVAGAIFEVIQREVACGTLAQLPLRLPQLTYIAIAPFTGTAEAIELVEGLVEQGAAVGRA